MVVGLVVIDDQVPTPEHASQQTAKQAPDDPEVNLSVRVPKSHRAWWTGKARMEGTTMTDLIKEFLEEKYGLPGSE